MTLMICWRVTPALTVRMTITSVVLGDGASEGGWADGDCDCATAASGYAERMNGSKNFIDAPRINVCRLITASIRALAVGSAPSRAPVDVAEEPGMRGRA